MLLYLNDGHKIVAEFAPHILLSTINVLHNFAALFSSNEQFLEPKHYDVKYMREQQITQTLRFRGKKIKVKTRFCTKNKL